MHEPWRLVECVTPRAHEWLTTENPFADSHDFHQQENVGRKKLAGRIYDHLRGLGIHYDHERPTDSDGQQKVRTVAAIFRHEKRGTCLDLALAFCGLCEGCSLIPCVFLLQGHAMAGIWLDHRMSDWDALGTTDGRQGWNALVGGIIPLSDKDARTLLEDYVKAGRVLAVECTGFARAQSFSRDDPEGQGRDEEGLLDFGRAVAAGTEQLERAVASISGQSRRLLNGIDIAVGRKDSRFEFDPLDIGMPPAKPGVAKKPRGRAAGVWPYRVDRQEQVEDLFFAIQETHESRRPLVCLVVGSNDDDHSGLVERAVRHELGPSWEKVFTDFPSPESAVDEQRFEATYLNYLDKKLPGSCSTIEKLVSFLRADPRRWVITSMAELTPGDPRNLAAIRSVVKFWSKVGEHLRDNLPDRLPLVWLQVVPSPEGRKWKLRLPWVLPNPKDQLHAQLKPMSVARCFRPLSLVRRSHLEAWMQNIDQDLLGPGADRIDLKPIMDLFPTELVTRPMRPVSKLIADLIEGRE
jgi:hypothetical protein